MPRIRQKRARIRDHADKAAENAEIRKVVDMIVASAQVEEKDESEKVNVQETLDAVAQAADAVTDADAKGEE